MEYPAQNPYINRTINPSEIEATAEKKATLRLITEIAYAINGSPSSDIPFPSTKETLNYIAFIRFLRTEIEKNPQIKNHPYIAPALNIGTVYTSQLGTTKLTEFTTNYRYPKMLDVDNYMKLVATTDANGKVVGISDKRFVYNCGCAGRIDESGSDHAARAGFRAGNLHVIGRKQFHDGLLETDVRIRCIDPAAEAAL